LVLSMLCSHQHVTPCLREVLGLKHSLKASLTRWDFLTHF